MPCGAPSPASTFVSAMPAARLIVVGALPARGVLAPMFSTLITRPQRRAFICGHASRVSRIAANSLRSRSSCQIASVTDSNGAVRAVPALFTTMSMRPNRAITASKARCTSSAFETSQDTVSTRPRAVAAIAACACANASGRRARMATSAPEAAKRVAIARPRPLLPPVITAVRPSNRISIVLFSFYLPPS